MWLFIVYLISVIIAYIILRYLVINKKFGMSDDPQIVSCLVAICWPIVLVIFGISELGDYIDRKIKSKING